MRRSLVSSLLIALALPAVAAARRPIVDSDPVAEAVARAVEYWHDTPCDGQVTVVSSPSSEAPVAGVNAPSPAGPLAAMWATWLTPAGANQFEAAGQAIPPVEFTGCVVHINSSVWPSWQADDSEFAAFCKEMLHEYGHFDGHPDAGAMPDTIEYERPDLAHLPLCERYRLVYGHRVYEPMRSSPRKTPAKRRRARPGARTADPPGPR
ncbi:MAG: hypothetical protein ACLQBY_17940 [Solirubrobacteraceae bacterium]